MCCDGGGKIGHTQLGLHPSGGVAARLLDLEPHCLGGVELGARRAAAVGQVGEHGPDVVEPCARGGYPVHEDGISWVRVRHIYSQLSIRATCKVRVGNRGDRRVGVNLGARSASIKSEVNSEDGVQNHRYRDSTCLMTLGDPEVPIPFPWYTCLATVRLPTHP